MASGLPYGYVLGLIAGTLLHYASRKRLTGLVK
jgi:hypothetical protein